MNLALIDDVGVAECTCADFIIIESDEPESARFLGSGQVILKTKNHNVWNTNWDTVEWMVFRFGQRSNPKIFTSKSTLCITTTAFLTTDLLWSLALSLYFSKCFLSSLLLTDGVNPPTKIFLPFASWDLVAVRPVLDIMVELLLIQGINVIGEIGLLFDIIQNINK